ncbi:dehydrogenase/reductase SDR family member 11 [Halyomorpha halys]|uniref:dehydrogenase/reductase SDR family member 11 n=1 Tax=Halyomorpha halys TaxID=286706 RepID=UPI0006D4F528|nr:dehydrogenase/reductase SDR family member 11 [Halyomorpha halys]
MGLKDHIAMVTGANSGIGLRVTEHFLGLGMTVIGLDKNIDNLKGLNERLHPLEVDLTNDVEITRSFQWSEENLGGIDILVNNAGIGGVTSLLDGNPVEWRKLFEVNVLALTHCAVEAVRSMRRREIGGHIINITSNLADHVPSYAPFHFYSATKHAAKAITEGLRKEVRNFSIPIRICSISPGLVKTGIFKYSLGDEMDKLIYDKYPSISPTDIASAIEYIIRSPENVNISEINIKPTGSES